MTYRHPRSLVAALVLAALCCQGRTESPTDPSSDATEPAPALAAAATGPLSFTQVSPGPLHTCGVTSDGRAYCWGAGYALGDGTFNPSLTPVAVIGGLRFRVVSAGANYSCGLTTDSLA